MVETVCQSQHHIHCSCLLWKLLPWYYYIIDDVDTLTQEDILSIAAQIADIIELGDLAVCLKLSLENIDKDDTKGNQVVTLLLQWQSRHSESSRTKLFGCLRKLKNPNIEEILKTFGEYIHEQLIHITCMHCQLL